MPSDLILKAMNTVHRAVLTLSGGKVGWQASGMPVIELHTVGRRTGQPRATMLTSPLQEGDTMVVVASRGGDDHHPAWFLNLEQQPEVEIVIKGQRRKMHARVATADERARLWPQIASAHQNYAGYQTKTSREIPLVLLEPS